MSIEINHLEHVYNAGTPFEHSALHGIDLSIPEGKVTAIIGQTGSGKSTLVQHLNGLLIPSAGTLDICGFHIQPLLKIKDVKALRKEVGLVFQFPEYQLFEETIEKDIAFGPKNFGVEEEKANELVKKILPMVGLDESYLQRSPFELSGGQKRRVAIAGILVLDPKVLVLDEPTAGLDPQGAKEMMSLFMDLNRTHNKTILLVSHDMEHVMRYCDHVIVLDHGKVLQESDVHTFFEHPEWMIKVGINPPAIIRLKLMLKEKGFLIPDEILELDALVKCIREQVMLHE
ncbi:energy-coupling factor transporter ATPase [Faecalicoccus pleomorphus]|uniref:energy-coupling factor transporter ATPase n=1 Tax=Faecalicoccus pleomorphus TaxID=1323 RepID=UPI00143179DE|nr:energy-coupling factor transporter ATPase [Faecalicoccus pleomorphus]MDM8292558.1 energy-coupling factor transporter ATPase [Faecalicoccus pleomorphus]NJE41437.1 energy-coupling factor transporter ATPase [Faecalicoccus pleomorphus]